MLRYWKGRLWIKQGFCPYCYSSPPRTECPICEGTNKYSYGMEPGTKKIWRERWDKFWEVFHS